MRYKMVVAVCFGVMLLLSAFSIAENANAVTREEEEDATRTTSGQIIDVRYYCSETSSSVDPDPQLADDVETPTYCSDITAGTFKAGQTVYVFVTIENDDVKKGTYYIEFSVADETGNTWFGEEKRTPLRPNEENSYSLGWIIPDDAPVGQYVGYVVLYGEKTKQTKQGIVATKSKLDTEIEDDAFSIIPSKDTYFVARAVDVDNEPIDLPVSLSIVESFGSAIIDEYTLPFTTLPESFTVPWVVPFSKDGTTVKIIALKEGYKESEAFVYSVTKFSPSSGELFEHIFVLEREELVKKEEPIEKVDLRTFEEKISVDGEDYVARIETTSNVEMVTLDQPLKKIIFKLEESGSTGSAKITMPKTLIEGPFTVNKSGVTFTQDATHSSVYLTYDAGVQTIEITGASVVPEFPIGNIVITVAMSMVVFAIIIARKRTNGLNSDLALRA
ncbi:MAG: hypothetical protein ACE5KA_06380 [Nitrososphaerales archaeon]